MPLIIRVSAVVIRDEQGRVLHVRKRGTGTLMLPGGKPEAGEDARDTAVREFAEELGAALSPVALKSLGVFTAAAANEPGYEVVASVYEHPYFEAAARLEPCAEIEHLEWVDLGSQRTDMAPLNTDFVFPLLLQEPGDRTPLRVAVFTGSASGNDPQHAAAATRLGTELAAAGIGVVFGGGHVGLMGSIADSALAADGEVIGVIPQTLVDREQAHSALTRIEVVADMHTRKHRMVALADAFVALPGGLGTLDELCEVWTWQNLGIHEKPIALYDVDGFWQPFLDMVDAMVAQGFISQRNRDSLVVVDSPGELVAELSNWQIADTSHLVTREAGVSK